MSEVVDACNGCLIESDSAVFTEIIREFGVKGVQVETGSYPVNLTKLPTRLSHGLIILFNWNGKHCSNNERGTTVHDNRLDKIFFTRQVIQIACASQALISVLLKLNHLKMDLGPVLSDFKEFTKPFDLSMKGLTLSNSDVNGSVHNSHTLSEFEVNSYSKEEYVLNFLGYVPIDGRLYELDGLQECPLDLGPIPAGKNWMEMADTLLNDRINKLVQDGFHFHLLAIVSDKKAQYEEQLIELQGSGDATSANIKGRIQHENYKSEDIRLKLKYLPLIVQFLKELAKEKQLLTLYESIKKMSKAQAETIKPKKSISKEKSSSIASKGKTSLASSDDSSRRVAFEAMSVIYDPLTKFTSSLLGSLLRFLLEKIESPDHLSSSQGKIDEKKSRLEIMEAITTTAESLPIISVKDENFQRLILHVFEISQKSIPTSEIPPLIILRLMKVTMQTTDWEDENSIRNMNKSVYFKQVCEYCLEILRDLMQLIENGLRRDFVTSFHTSVLEGVLATETLGAFAKFRFGEFFPVSLHIATTVFDAVSKEDMIEMRFHTGGIEEGLTLDEAKEPHRFDLCRKYYVAYYDFFKSVTSGIGLYMKDHDLGSEYLQTYIKLWHRCLIRLPNFSKETLRLCPQIAGARIDCFAAVNDLLFESMPHKRQLFCVVNILGNARHEIESVRAKVGRCIALYLEFKTFANDAQYLLDSFDIIFSQISTAEFDAVTQSMFSWAAANLADALGKHHRQTRLEQFDWTMYRKLFHLGLKLVQNTQKMRHHGYRILGSLTYWTPEKFLTKNRPELLECLKRIASILGSRVAKGNDFKGRWNAAYALSNFLKHHELWENFHQELFYDVFEPLMRMIRNSDNFKERSYSVRAFNEVKKKEYFGPFYSAVFQCLIKALPSIKNPTPTNPTHQAVEQAYKEEVALALVNICGTLDENEENYLKFLESIFKENEYQILVKGMEITSSRSNYQELLNPNAWNKALDAVLTLHNNAKIREGDIVWDSLNDRIETLTNETPELL